MQNMSSIDIFFLVCAVMGGMLFLVRTILFFVGGIGDTGLDGDLGDLNTSLDADLDGDWPIPIPVSESCLYKGSRLSL